MMRFRMESNQHKFISDYFASFNGSAWDHNHKLFVESNEFECAVSAYNTENFWHLMFSLNEFLNTVPSPPIYVRILMRDRGTEHSGTKII